jgi:hypothetical protein
MPRSFGKRMGFCRGSTVRAVAVGFAAWLRRAIAVALAAVAAALVCIAIGMADAVAE